MAQPAAASPATPTSFRDLKSIDRVIETKQNSDVCAAFFSIMDGDGSHRVYEVLKSYE